MARPSVAWGLGFAREGFRAYGLGFRVLESRSVTTRLLCEKFCIASRQTQTQTAVKCARVLGAFSPPVAGV